MRARAGKLLHIEELKSEVFNDGEIPVRNGSAPDSIATLIYTSGSTGQPKGAMIPHRAIVRAVSDRSYLDITPLDRIAQVMSPSFDVCVLEVWSALANGATLVGISRQDMLDTSAMARILREEQISVLCLPALHPAAARDTRPRGFCED